MSSESGGKKWSSTRGAQRVSSLCDLSVSYEGYSEEIQTRPPDISTRGMFINTNRGFPEGAVLNVQFRLALTGAEVRTRCEVRYCLPGVGVGVEFVDISPDGVEAIEKEIQLGTASAHKAKSIRPSKVQA
jgi:PilZ domain-containing protein